jgi:phosphate-selective porin OprO/OprP
MSPVAPPLEEKSFCDANLAGGRGDVHHSFYGGLNYYLCGHNMKVMAGLQYDDMERDDESIYEGWTTYVGFRTFF